MGGIGVILNPRSKRNLGDPRAATRLARALGDHGVVRTVKDRDDLSRIAEVLSVGIEHLTHGREKRANLQAGTGDELALLRLYRECAPEDRQLLLRTARRLAKR